MNADGTVHKYRGNVDIDIVTPVRYLSTGDPKELAEKYTYDIDTDFVKKIKVNDITAAGFSFGYGGGREHVPIAIKASDISCVIAKSLARIFYRNMISIGLPTLGCMETNERASDKDEVKINFDTGEIINKTKNEIYQAQPFPVFIQNIMQHNGLLNTIREQGGEQMEKHIAVIPGDGIGPEIVEEAVRILDVIAKKYGHRSVRTEMDAGSYAIDKYGTSLLKESLDAAPTSDSVLLGAVSGSKWDRVGPSIRPEKVLLSIRGELGLYANLRSAKAFKKLSDTSPLRKDIVTDGTDSMVVRRLTGGVYFGGKSTVEKNGELHASDNMCYYTHEIERIAHTVFQTARRRGNCIIFVDRVDVLDTFRLRHKIVSEVTKEYPDVILTHVLVDNVTMQIMKDPPRFDVVVTKNMFGNILSDEASIIVGSIDLIPSTSLEETKRGMYEPIHGSVSGVAGQNIASPIGTILAAGMMLKYAFDMDQEAMEIEEAVGAVLCLRYRTEDIIEGKKTYRVCSQMGDTIVELVTNV